MKGFPQFVELTRARILSHGSTAPSGSSSKRLSSVAINTRNNSRVARITSTVQEKSCRTSKSSSRNDSTTKSSSSVSKAQHSACILRTASSLSSKNNMNGTHLGCVRKRQNQNRKYTSTAESFEDRENFIAGVGFVGVLVTANALVIALENKLSKKGKSVVRDDYGPSKIGATEVSSEESNVKDAIGLKGSIDQYPRPCNNPEPILLASIATKTGGVVGNFEDSLKCGKSVGPLHSSSLAPRAMGIRFSWRKKEDIGNRIKLRDNKKYCSND